MSDLGKYLEAELDNETIAQIQAKVLHITHQYNMGKALFPRTLLEDLNRQIDQHCDEIQVPDFDDIPRTYSLKVPGWCADFANTYRINYRSIHDLSTPTPVCPELVLRNDHCPVSIGYTRTSALTDSTLDEVHSAFLAKRHLWTTTSTYHDLVHHLSTLPLSTPISKIVCFGLGPMGRLESYHTARAHVQHAAVETMAAVLAARGATAGRKIECFAQDPAYDAVDVELLRRIGIVVLDDPKGFLEVDEETLVFSVSPNVPVKQIVVDGRWPAAMVWNTVMPAEKDRKQWVKIMEKNGDETWTSPFTTDPDSRRVRKMIMQYAQAQLHDPHEYLGDLTIYTK
ncbi:hypothetical protein FE257_000088 [Aspergillus nanangensis]|uniref:SRR1-like domain-containing protein n=1 Tax=Aspergillus nanangensis TaxID=2582783 RepID=A0AAD4CYR3_ASPNN|nr:hypothetical protein FE257_000088 [Aspergillus nanangensis]